MHPHHRQNNTFSGLTGGYEALLAAPLRFSFNGQERDDEVSGEGNAISYAYRIHDARLGRFKSVDPLTNSFPWNSSYAFCENRVISGIELEGLEAWDLNSTDRVNGPYKDQDAASDAANAGIAQVYRDGTEGFYTKPGSETMVQKSGGDIPGGHLVTTDPTWAPATTTMGNVPNGIDVPSISPNPGGTISSHTDNILEQARQSSNLLVSIGYGTLDGIYSLPQLVMSPNERRHLGGAGFESYNDAMGTQLGGLMDLAGIVGGFAGSLNKTVPRTDDVLGHIFKDVRGHVNPSSMTSKERYLKLFEHVANNPLYRNDAVLSNFQRLNKNWGFEGFSYKFKNGEVWVQTRNNRIFDAGVNK